MKVLVSVASKHGATGEIGEIIAGVLRDARFEVASIAPEEVTQIDDFEAVILGSAVYMGGWLDTARSLVDRLEPELRALPVWLLSSGPIGDPPKPEGDPPETAEIARRLGAREHRTFAGRLERDRLGILERTVAGVVRAPDGDFRDLDEVRAWADEIATTLTSGATVATAGVRAAG